MCMNDSEDIILCLILIFRLELWPVTEENANMAQMFSAISVFYYRFCEKKELFIKFCRLKVKWYVEYFFLLLKLLTFDCFYYS